MSDLSNIGKLACYLGLPHIITLTTDDICKEALKVLNTLQCHENWDGKEQLFVGAIVKQGVIEVITDQHQKVCIRLGNGGLIIIRKNQVIPPMDDAELVVTEYMRHLEGENIRATYADSLLTNQLRKLAEMGLIRYES